MVVLSAENVFYSYRTKYQTVHALRGISCRFEAGKFYAIVGRSGSGKTTLLSLLAGLSQPVEGTIKAYGKPLSETGLERHRRENVSVIYQSYNLFPQLTALENVLYPMEIQGEKRKQVLQTAKDLLTQVGIQEKQFRQFPRELSGGEQQRVAIARALGSKAKVILGDEPTGNLDSENGKIIVDLLMSLAREQGYCVIVVTHDLAIADQADVVYRMKDGRWEDAP